MFKIQSKSFKSKIAFSLARQYHGMWEMLRQSIEKIPDNHWFQGLGDDEWFYSLRVYHIIETAEFYARDTYENWKWGRQLGLENWWESITHKEAAQRVTKIELLDYLKKIEKRILKILKKASDVDLQKKDGFHWFSSILEKFQYLLRHNSFHIGELTLFLREIKSERIKWS